MGNGFSASLSAESRRATQIIGQGVNVNGFTTLVNVGGVPFFIPGLSSVPNVGSINGSGGLGAAANVNTGIGYGGWSVPDVVANLRVDQAWGSAAIAGALHEVNAAYNLNAQGACVGGVLGGGAACFTPEGSGHPDNKWGWAVMAGLRLNTPYIGTGDFLQLQGIYTQGALRYIMQNPSNNNWWIQHGFNSAYGVVADGVYGGTAINTFTGGGTVFNNTATGIQLTTAWGLNASYEHFWNPRWRTSLYGGYTSVGYNGQANAILCTLQGSGVNVIGGAAAGVGVFAVAGPGCDNNWTSWWIGSRTQWNVTKDFYMGLDVAYLKVDGASTSSGQVVGGAVVPGQFAQTGIAGANNATVGLKALSDEGIWMARFRVHRDFYP